MTIIKKGYKNFNKENTVVILSMRKVEKVWGSELWLCNTPKYCGKILELKGGWRCSLHSHAEKDETFFILSGTVLMEMDGKIKTMYPGESIRIPPCTIHRFTGLGNSTIIETSTHHDEKDTYRLEKSGYKPYYIFDLDDTICTKEDKYKNAKPKTKMIKMINELYDKGEIIIIWAGRGRESNKDYEKLTKKQLNKWGVKYTGLFMKKPWCKIIDDDAMTPEGFLKER